jgi:hypothetical protein
MSNVDGFYKNYEEMTTLISTVTDDNLRQDLWEKLQWLKTYFDCLRMESCEFDDKQRG